MKGRQDSSFYLEWEKYSKTSYQLPSPCKVRKNNKVPTTLHGVSDEHQGLMYSQFISVTTKVSLSVIVLCGNGGGGFFPPLPGFLGKCSTIHSLPALFFLLFLSGD